MPLSHSSQTDQYLVHHQGQTQGPFGVDFIEAMVMSGVYPAAVLVENIGTSARTPFSDVAARHKIPPLRTAPQTGSDPNTPTASKPRPKKTKPDTVVAQVVGVFAVLVVIWIIATVTSSKKTPRSSFAATPSPTSSSNTYSQPVRTSTSSSRPSASYPSSRTPSPPADTMVYRDASGRTYRVSNSDYLRLSRMQTALSFKQSGLNVEEARLKSLAAEVDRDRATLDSYSQYAVDAFNRKVNQVNSMNSRVQSLVDDYNRDVDAFNRDLERVGTLIR